MATQTRTQAVLGHHTTPEPPAEPVFTIARVEVDYDDVLLRILTVRCVNGTPVPVRVTATKISNGRSISRVFAANSTTEQAVPQGAAARLDITIDSRGRLDGVSWSIGWSP